MKYILLSLLLILFLNSGAQTWHQLLRENGLQPMEITVICTDNSGNVYIGTLTNGAYKYNGSGFTQLSGLLSSNVRAIECDNSGRVWMGFSSGLSCWNNGTVTNYNTQTGMQSPSVYSLKAGTGNVIWIGTGNGLLRYNGLSFVQYTTSDGLPSNMIRTLDFDGTNLWIGTSSGLSKFDGSVFTNYTTSNGLPSNDIRTVHYASTNKVWIGTNSGSAMFNGTAFSVLDTSSGLSSNSIKGITSDINGAIWFSTSKGISRKDGSGLINFSIYNFYPIIENNSSQLSIGNIFCENNDIYVATDREFYRTKIWANSTMQDTYIETSKVKLKITDFYGIVSYNYNDSTSTYNGGLEFPNGTGKTTVFISSMWLGGMDPSQNILLAGNIYLDSDFFPGPEPGSDNPTDTYDSLYHRIWKVTKQEVDYHIQNWNQPGYLIPEAIKNWPSLYSEYVDINGNNSYEPDQGDFPKIRGNVSVLKLMNDNRYNHPTGGNKLKFTAAILYYTYDTTLEALEHTIFVNINVTNNNIFPVTDLYLGIQGDLDIGYWMDDYTGCDSNLSCYYLYNGSSNDNIYGNNIPAQGIAFLSSPLYSFTYYSFSMPVSPTSDPIVPSDFYYNLRGLWKDGTPYTYGGNGYGGANATHFVFNGDPVTGNGWSEVSEMNTPGDRRVVGSIGPFFIDPGKSKCIDFAYVTGLDSTGNNLLSINKMKQNVAEVIQLYNTTSFFCDTIHISLPTIVEINCDPVVVCKNIPYELHPSVSGYYWPMTYTWSPTTGLSDTTIVNPVATLSSNTTYYVTVTDAHGNTDTDSLVVIVSDPQLTLDPLYEMCSGERITLPHFSWYQWSTTAFSQWCVFTSSGNYWVRVRDDNGCWSDTSFFTVNVTQSPVPNLGSTISMCIGDDTTLNAGSGYISYLWNTGGTSSQYFVNGNILTPGNYLYSVTVTDATGCTGSDQIVVKINDCAFAENISPDYPGYVYPNPFVDYIRIEPGEPGTGPYTLELFDASGRAIAKHKGDIPELYIPGVSAGFYTLRYNSSRRTVNYRLVKVE